MVKEFPDSKSGVLASVLLIMQQRMPKSLASCVVDTTDDDMDCCTGNFDDSNCLCCYTCMVECSPFSDIDDPNGASCKDHFRNGNLNCTTNHYQECQSCMNSGSCFWQRELLCRDYNAQDQQGGSLPCLATAERSSPKGRSTDPPGFTNAFLGDAFGGIACVLSFV